jgi:cholesterol transport system auxiliary component
MARPVSIDVSAAPLQSGRAAPAGPRNGIWQPWLATAVLAAALAGCASPPAAQIGTYDLGLTAAPAAGPIDPAAAVVVPDVTAAAALDSDRMRYRLAYLNQQQIGTYAGSRWTAPPAQLMTEALRARLGSEVPVLAHGGADSLPVLRVELIRFDQAYAQAGAGQGNVALRATLTRDGRLIGQRVFESSVAMTSADAAGGAQALSRASGSALDALVAWYRTEARR